MTMRSTLPYSSLLAVFLLAGCGFHLRGTGGDRVAIGAINVSAANAHGEMQRTLERTLTDAGVRIEEEDKAPWSVRLLGETSTRRPVATSSDVKVAQYGLRLEVSFTLDAAGGKTVIPETSVSAERIYRFDSSSFAGNSEEESLLYDEMRRDVARQIMQRIDASVRAAGGKQ